jgi:hypothetical protein
LESRFHLAEFSEPSAACTAPPRQITGLEPVSNLDCKIARAGKAVE